MLVLYSDGLIVHFLEEQHVGPSCFVLVVLFPETMIKPKVKISSCCWRLWSQCCGSFSLKIAYYSAGCSKVGFTRMGKMYYCLPRSSLFRCKKPFEKSINNGGLAVDFLSIETPRKLSNRPIRLFCCWCRSLYLLFIFICMLFAVLRPFHFQRLEKSVVSNEQGDVDIS
jgi:hypothetical protein